MLEIYCMSKKIRELIANPSPEISKSMNIPTNLKEGELNQKTESHPHFKNYDHSLDMKRKIGLKSANPTPNEDGYVDCGDGLEMGNLTSKDILGD